MIYYNNTEQISELTTYKFELPKFGKSTTDPTYYEPAATRIANMRRSAGVQLEGVYDFYTKDDVQKFNEQNFKNNIKEASVDPKYVKGLTREEISQVTTQYENQVEKTLENKKNKADKKAERINESIEINKIISEKNTIQNNNKDE